MRFSFKTEQTRALASQAAETEKINFLVGTQSRTKTNKVSVMCIKCANNFV